MLDEVKLSKVRGFLSRADLSETEQKIKDKALGLDQSVAKARKELDQLNKSVNEKQMEVLALSQQLEGMCSLIVELAETEPTDEAPPEVGGENVSA